MLSAPALWMANRPQQRKLCNTGNDCIKMESACHITATCCISRQMSRLALPFAQGQDPIAPCWQDRFQHYSAAIASWMDAKAGAIRCFGFFLLLAGGALVAYCFGCIIPERPVFS
jgi:hypothetical protein